MCAYMTRQQEKAMYAKKTQKVRVYKVDEPITVNLTKQSKTGLVKKGVIQ